MKKSLCIIVALLLIPTLVFAQGWVKLSDGTYAKTDISETITIEQIDDQIAALTRAIQELPALRVYDGKDSGIQEIVEAWNMENVTGKTAYATGEIERLQELKRELQAL